MQELRAANHPLAQHILGSHVDSQPAHGIPAHPMHRPVHQRGGAEMIVDSTPVYMVVRQVLRCNECPKQVTLFLATGCQVDELVAQVGWYDAGNDTHFCEEHS